MRWRRACCAFFRTFHPRYIPAERRQGQRLQPTVCHQGHPYPLQLLCLDPASYDLPGVATLGNLHSVISFIGVFELDFNHVVDHSAIKGACRKVLCEFDRGISLVGFSSIHGMVPSAVDARQKISRWVQALAVYELESLL